MPGFPGGSGVQFQLLIYKAFPQRGQHATPHHGPVGKQPDNKDQKWMV
jgi:hypothetical protein